MIFDRAVRREFVQSAAGISVALLAILLSTQLIRLLNDAAGGRIAPEAVLALLGFAALNFMPVLLTLTVFISVLICLSRAYRDSEMVVWFSCGQPLTAWIRPVMRFALPLILAIALLSMFLSPWANLRSAEYKEKLGARKDASQVSPGAFREARKGERVVFVEAIESDISKVRNIFVASMQDGKLGVVMAARGHQEYAANGDRFMVLERGSRYEVEPGTPEFKIMDFERYALRSEDSAVRPADTQPNRMPVWSLIREGGNASLGELLWRIGMPLSALLLSLLAIPLSFVNPRAGRSGNMVMAILIYAVYNNLISVSQAWVTQGKLSFWVGVWGVHAAMALIVLIFFYRRLVVCMPWQRRSAR